MNEARLRQTPITALAASATLLLLQVFSASGRAAGQPWHPQPEPSSWAEVRRSLEKLGPPGGLSAGPWIFVRASDRADLRAAEYLVDVTAGQGLRARDVQFRAAVLLQRPGEETGWQVRERRMRALCGEGRLQMLAPSGVWRDTQSSDDPEAPARLAWICSGAVVPKTSDAITP
jgi:hypothetical protein